MDGQIDAELASDRAKLRKQELAGIADRAWAFYAADLAATELDTDEAKAELAALAARVAKHDRELSKWARPLFGDEPGAAEVLDDIARGRGRRDDADDVLRLVKLFRKGWEQIEAKQLVSAETLDEAEADAKQLLDHLSTSASDPARDLAARAYSAWARDYQELKDLGRYIARADADAAARFPGIHTAISRASKKPEPEPE